MSTQGRTRAGMTAVRRADIIVGPYPNPLVLEPKGEVMLPEYRSTTYLDYSRPEHDAGMREALALVRSQADASHPLVIDGKRIQTTATFQSHNPANPSECLGVFSKGGAEHVELAVEAATKAFPAWAAVPAE